MNSSPHPDSGHATADLLARYDRPGPRYTSYPTAIAFHEGFTEADYRARLALADARPDEPLSLYVHLPFCEERCLYCGCNVVIIAARRGLEAVPREPDRRDRPARRGAAPSPHALAAALGRRHADVLHRLRT